MKRHLPDPRKLPWRSWAQRYGWRFATCLVVLGLVYGFVFGFRLTARKLPQTTAQKIASLRNALDETYLFGNSLIGFKQSNALAGYDLTSTFDNYQLAHKHLQTDLQKAPHRVTPVLKQQLQAVLDRQNRTITDYTTLISAVSQVIAYDPTGDLGSLDIQANATTIVSRATAAQTGLTKASNSVVSGVQSGDFTVKSAGQVPLLSSAATGALTNEASCFGKLASQLQNQQYAIAQTTRQTCIKNYAALRSAAITDVMTGSFNSNYQQYMQTNTQPLLASLDRLIN